MTRTWIALVTATLLSACGDDMAGSASDSAGSTTAGATDGTTDGTTESTTAASATESDSATGSTTATTASTTAGTTGSADMCTSMIYWTKGDQESPLMHPGKACLTCHQTQVGEDIQDALSIAGTVFPSLREPDECNGVNGASDPVTVEITTADNMVLNLPVNSAGNFMYDQLELGPILFPIKAKVIRGDKEIAMTAAQATGDCNSCHTQNGLNGAPGRILAP